MRKTYNTSFAPRGVSYNDWMLKIDEQLKTDKARLSSEKNRLSLSEKNTHSMLNWDTEQALDNRNYGPSTVKEPS